ncbi:MAG TPA: hypothetical protein VFY39_15645, partial [Gammaproteobacteria bacterium]|nr:hypothetical protein [Gammaproteobacteria bacterium]
MRSYVGLLAVLLAGCAANPTTPTAADNGHTARCTVTDCFNARDVRSFQIIDASTAVAYVGQQRCPFVIDLDGVNCSPTFGPHVQLPKIQFYQGGGAANANLGLSSRVCNADQQLYLYTGIPHPGPLTPDGTVDPVTGRPLGLGAPADSPVRPLGGLSTLPPFGNEDLGSLGPASRGGRASVP